MSRPLGYVVIEYNQASHQPDLWDGSLLYDSKEDALATANILWNRTQESGRRETYTVGVVTELEDDD